MCIRDSSGTIHSGSGTLNSGTIHSGSGTIHSGSGTLNSGNIHTGSGTLTADPSKRAVGVVCSDEDLKAIVHRHKRRQSPTVSPTTEYEAGAPSLFPPTPEDVEDRTVSFTVTAAVDRADTHGVSAQLVIVPTRTVCRWSTSGQARR